MVDELTQAEKFLKQFPNEPKAVKGNKYQGPVQKGYNEKKFRETGKYEKLKEKKKENKFDKISKLLKQKVVYKPTKSKQMIVTIKESKPAEYVNRYFKNEWEETKKSLFF